MDQQQPDTIPAFERARAFANARANARADTLGLTGDLRAGVVGGYVFAFLDIFARYPGAREAVGWPDAAHD